MIDSDTDFAADGFGTLQLTIVELENALIDLDANKGVGLNFGFFYILLIISSEIIP
jgi:hypothetical protein